MACETMARLVSVESAEYPPLAYRAANSPTRAACWLASAATDAATLPESEEMSTWSVALSAAEPALVDDPVFAAFSAAANLLRGSWRDPPPRRRFHHSEYACSSGVLPSFVTRLAR